MSYVIVGFHTDFCKEMHRAYIKHLKIRHLLTLVVWIKSCITLVFAVICVLGMKVVELKARVDGRDLAVWLSWKSQL